MIVEGKGDDHDDEAEKYANNYAHHVGAFSMFGWNNVNIILSMENY